MRRRLMGVFDTDEGIKSKDSKAGDILLYNKSTKKLALIDQNTWTASLYPSTKYTPVGVVAVPGTHNQYGDNSCGIISLKWMSTSTPSTGGSSYERLYFGPSSAISGLSDYSTCVHVGKVKLNKTTRLGTATMLTFFSDLLTSGTVCATDSLAKAANNSNVTPSPYNGANANSVYKQASSDNGLSDFNGKANTDVIIAKRGSISLISNNRNSYPAASTCNAYTTDGTLPGDWYLPAHGEMGYATVRFKAINTILSKLNTTYGSVSLLTRDSYSIYWVSTEAGTYQWDWNMYTYLTRTRTKEYQCVVRAFLKFKN